jgi:hypothetical protein
MLAITDCTAYLQSADRGRRLALLIATSSSDSIVALLVIMLLNLVIQKMDMSFIFSFLHII